MMMKHLPSNITTVLCHMDYMLVAVNMIEAIEDQILVYAANKYCGNVIMSHI